MNELWYMPNTEFGKLNDDKLSHDGRLGALHACNTNDRTEFIHANGTISYECTSRRELESIRFTLFFFSEFIHFLDNIFTFHFM